MNYSLLCNKTLFQASSKKLAYLNSKSFPERKLCLQNLVNAFTRDDVVLPSLLLQLIYCRCVPYCPNKLLHSLKYA